MAVKVLMIIVLAAYTAFAATGKVHGTVVDQNGMPASHFVVEAFPLEMGWSGGIPQSITDENGRFEMTVVTGRANGKPYGVRWAIYPHQEQGDYYPDLSSKFYTTSDSAAKHIEFPSELPEVNVELKLSTKAGAVVVSVRDGVTGAPVKGTLQFARSSDLENKMGHSSGGHDRILVPSRNDVTLTVFAPGYEPFSYPGTINLEPGQDMTVDVQLKPLAAK